MRIDVEEVLKLATRRREINRLDFEEIEWYQDGKKLNIPLETANYWCRNGLNNVDFVTSALYHQTGLGPVVTNIYIIKDKE